MIHSGDGGSVGMGYVWCRDRPLGDTELRTRTSVSIVAVIRDGTAIPSPTPMFVFAAGDVVVAVGTVEGLAAATEILRSEA